MILVFLLYLTGQKIKIEAPITAGLPIFRDD